LKALSGVIVNDEHEQSAHLRSRMVDADRFERVWTACAAEIFRYCEFSCGSRHAAEDLAAETFARFLSRGEHVDEDGVEAWLFTVARNLCVSFHRASARDIARTRRFADTLPKETGGWVDRDVWSLVARLSERERLVIYLHTVEQREFQEVAAVLGKSQSAVKMTYYRAMERLRRDLARSESVQRRDLGRESGA
jgi:RNA polymerase sigma-70 factor (ECF subfamily)